MVADDYELTHKMSAGKTNFQSKGFYKNTDKGKSGSEAQSSTGSPDPSDKKPSSSSGAKWDQRKKSFPPCDYCHKKGYSKARCFKFIADERERSEKPVVFVRIRTIYFVGSPVRPMAAVFRLRRCLMKSTKLMTSTKILGTLFSVVHPIYTRWWRPFINVWWEF